jgi:flagellar basal-body rod modification protein FlgD
MDDKEFITQLAQFSSLEQMQSMKTSMQTLLQSEAAAQAISLVGRTITWTDADSGKNLSGKVEGVDFKSGVPLLKVQDKEVPLGYVLDIS